jgi:hypothetical protein
VSNNDGKTNNVTGAGVGEFFRTRTRTRTESSFPYGTKIDES